jgi:hypothetical protein
VNRGQSPIGGRRGFYKLRRNSCSAAVLKGHDFTACGKKALMYQLSDVVSTRRWFK